MVLQQFTFKRIDHNSLSKRFITTKRNGFAAFFSYSSSSCSFVEHSIHCSVVIAQVRAVQKLPFHIQIVKINLCVHEPIFHQMRTVQKSNEKEPCFINWLNFVLLD